MRKNKIPQYIINAIRRRAAAAEQWRLADDRINAYCERLGLDSEFVHGNVETIVRFYDPDFFIRDLEECLARKAQEGGE